MEEEDENERREAEMNEKDIKELEKSGNEDNMVHLQFSELVC